MAASAARSAMAVRASMGRHVAFVRRIPWTAATNELREHFAQFGHVRKCTLPFTSRYISELQSSGRFIFPNHHSGSVISCFYMGQDKATGFHRGMGWIQFSTEEELHNALQQENHVIDGVKLHVQVRKPKNLQGDQTTDEERDF